MPLGELPQRLHEVPRDRPLAVHCASNFRAGVAASILAAQGFPSVHHIIDGFEELRKVGLPATS
jgi:hydroxyacylglutathione hydrolase